MGWYGVQRIKISSLKVFKLRHPERTTLARIRATEDCVWWMTMTREREASPKCTQCAYVRRCVHFIPIVRVANRLGFGAAHAGLRFSWLAGSTNGASVIMDYGFLCTIDDVWWWNSTLMYLWIHSIRIRAAEFIFFSILFQWTFFSSDGAHWRM